MSNYVSFQSKTEEQILTTVLDDMNCCFIKISFWMLWNMRKKMKRKFLIGRKGGCAVLIVHIYFMFLSLYILKEIFFDLVFECVYIVGGFQVKC